VRETENWCEALKGEGASTPSRLNYPWFSQVRGMKTTNVQAESSEVSGSGGKVDRGMRGMRANVGIAIIQA